MKSGVIIALILANTISGAVKAGSEHTPYPPTSRPPVENRKPMPDTPPARAGNTTSFVAEQNCGTPDPIQRTFAGYIAFLVGMLLLVRHPEKP